MLQAQLDLKHVEFWCKYKILRDKTGVYILELPNFSMSI